eukprot:TRINITY_DN29007_c0_g1_i1.p1 TRINITY_DN29007_c0_g1~~TRINITY_DN29007_c0_g1_i1.p1  ORF type:complete len:389 (-),score=54.05 TRINITY_DN29007_c0_g1_i1:79-1245(-)
MAVTTAETALAPIPSSELAHISGPKSDSGSDFFELPDAGDQFAWAEDDDYWVMGKMGMQKLAQLNATLDQAKLMPPPQPRPKTPAELAIEKSRADPPDLKTKLPERRGACGMFETCNCKCKKYDPVLVLPHSLFTRAELALDFEPAARRLVQEADLYADGYWDEETVKDHFYVYVEEYTPKPFLDEGVRCRTMYYRLRQDIGLEDVAAIPRLEELGSNINDILLPKLAKWCDEYFASKRLHEKQTAVEKQEQGHTAAHMVHIRDQGEFLHSNTTWRSNAASAEDFTEEQQRKNRKRNVCVPVPRVDRPRHVCRCGHGEVWHMRSDNALDVRPPPPQPRAANPIFVIDQGAGQRPLQNLPRSVLARPDVMLNAGKMVMHDSSNFSGMLG